MPPHIDTLFTRFRTTLTDGTFVKISLTSRRNKGSDLKAVIAQRILIKAGEKLSITYRHERQDIVKNYDIEEGIQLITNALESEFLNAELFTTIENTLVLIHEWKVKLKTTPAPQTSAPSLSHDHQKKRFIQPKGNVYLRELGITSPAGEVLPSMQDKFRQIDKFLEIIDSLIKEAKFPEMIRVTDMGSGKGYLTFAVYDYLVNSLHLPSEVVGIEYRNELVDICSRIAHKAHFNGLSFVQGSIETAEVKAMNILIALHACDTATDEAIFRGIRSDAELIICSPCCHRQIRKDLSVSHGLSAILQSGILEERQAEIVTDGLRALIMEYHGYSTKVFEFISSEHTGKNLMITGVKNSQGVKKREEVLEKITEIKNFFGIKKHHLEMLMGM